MIAEILSKEWLVNVQRQNCHGAVQDGVEGTENCSKDNGGKEPYEHRWHDIPNQSGISPVVVLKIVAAIEMEDNDPGERDVEYVQYFEKRGKHHTLLAFF